MNHFGKESENAISKLYEGFRSILLNNYMMTALVESFLLDEVEVFCQGLHQS